MNLLTVNLQDKMIAANRRVLATETATLKHQADMDAQIEKLRLGAEKVFKEGKTLDVAGELGFDYKVREAAAINSTNAAISHLPQERIFTLAAIKDICVTYGLRFLPTSYYKGALDEGIGAAVQAFKDVNGKEVVMYYIPSSHAWGTNTATGKSQYFIAAPTASFNLSPRPKDPLLFAALGNDRFYLIHKWGDDLSVMARVKNHNWRWFVAILACVSIAIPYGIWAHRLASTSTYWKGFEITTIFMFVPILIAWAANWLETESVITSSNWNSPYSR